MTEQEHYAQIDLPFYQGEIEPILPVQILDFHAHIWRKQDWKSIVKSGKLPKELDSYVKFIETDMDVFIEFISCGPEKEMTIERY